MVIGRGLQAEHHLPQAMLHLERVRLNQKLLKTIIGIVKEHSFMQRFAGRRTKEGIVPLFGNIQPDDQMLC